MDDEMIRDRYIWKGTVIGLLVAIGVPYAAVLVFNQPVWVGFIIAAILALGGEGAFTVAGRLRTRGKKIQKR